MPGKKKKVPPKKKGGFFDRLDPKKKKPPQILNPNTRKQLKQLSKRKTGRRRG